jgi:hypothetical protein
LLNAFGAGVAPMPICARALRISCGALILRAPSASLTSFYHLINIDQRVVP